MYYLERATSKADQRLMKRIDALNLAHPFMGSRMLRDMLNREGCITSFPLNPMSGEHCMRKRRATLAAGLVLSLSGCGYNTFQTTDEQVKAGWSEVINQYQRRANLIPNLVSTVKGEAKFEQDTLTQVIEARAWATSIQATPELINNPAAFQKFQQAQGELAGALSRLMVVPEQYPNLRANQGLRDVSAQLEGSENRIALARNRYIAAVQAYNVTLRSFPSNLTAMVFGYKEKPSFAVDNEKDIAEPPGVFFDGAPAKPAGAGSAAAK